MNVLGDLVQLYKVGFSNETGSETNWDYYNSIFFATTVLSTIGTRSFYRLPTRKWRFFSVYTYA